MEFRHTPVLLEECIENIRRIIEITPRENY